MPQHFFIQVVDGEDGVEKNREGCSTFDDHQIKKREHNDMQNAANCSEKDTGFPLTGFDGVLTLDAIQPCVLHLNKAFLLQNVAQTGTKCCHLINEKG